MALTKGFFIKEATFTAANYEFSKSNVRKIFKIKGAMSRSIAQALGIKDVIYPENVTDGSATVGEHKVVDEMIGPTITIRPTQANLLKTLKERNIQVLALNSIDIKKHGDNQKLITVSVKAQDDDSQIDALITAMGRETFDFDVKPGSKTAIAQASAQLNLSAEEEQTTEGAEQDTPPAKVKK